LIALLANCTNRILVNLVHRKISSHIYQPAREVKVMDSQTSQQLQDEQIQNESDETVNNSSLNTSVENSGVTEDNSLELKAQTKFKLINLTQDFALTSCIWYQGRQIC
jgi:hypothetical protein